jgi:CRISPR type III-A/MTUBE-associated protein Csm6
MTTLFSPIGTADPFTQLGDAAMIHIVRHRRPNKVILFFSPALGQNEKTDARYSKAIKLLAANIGIDAPEIECVYSQENDVFKFDTYITEFENILRNERAKNGGEEILVNVSSGTSGMSQALVSLGSFGRLGLKLLQVVTPKHGINGQHDREEVSTYDLQQMWEWAQEIETASDAECRIIEVECPNFGDKLLVENVATLINKFEYASALDMYLQVAERNSQVENLLSAAQNRLSLACTGVDAKLFKQVGIPFSPEDQITEYIEVMNVRLQQGHFSEYLMMLTPVIDKLLRKYLEANRVSLKTFLQEDSNGKLTDSVDMEKLKRDPRLAQIMVIKPYSSKNIYVNSHHLKNILESCSSDGNLLNNFNDLICVQRECRNILAHTIAKTGRAELENKMRTALLDQQKRGNIGLVNSEAETKRRKNFTFEDLMALVAKLNQEPLKNIYAKLNQKIVSML